MHKLLERQVLHPGREHYTQELLNNDVPLRQVWQMLFRLHVEQFEIGQSRHELLKRVVPVEQAEQISAGLQ
jgi:hypothetical protein